LTDSSVVLGKYAVAGVTGGSDDHADSNVILAMLDSVLRRHDSHPTPDAQFSARVAVPLHDARHSLGRLSQQLPQPTYLCCTQQQFPPRFQAGIATVVYVWLVTGNCI